VFASGGEDVNEVSSYLAVLDAVSGRRIALIVGGHDRGIDYAPLAAGILAREAATHVLTLPESGPYIHPQIQAAHFLTPHALHPSVLPAPRTFAPAAPSPPPSQASRG
jgi:UDP-N-acetylmuramoylalanine-D-glutamate ligase